MKERDYSSIGNTCTQVFFFYHCTVYGTERVKGVERALDIRPSNGVEKGKKNAAPKMGCQKLFAFDQTRRGKVNKFSPKSQIFRVFFVGRNPRLTHTALKLHT